MAAAKRKLPIPRARVKQIMLHNQDVPRMKKLTPDVLSLSVARYLENLIQKCLETKLATDSNRLTKESIRRVVDSNDMYDFLTDVIDKPFRGSKRRRRNASARKQKKGEKKSFSGASATGIRAATLNAARKVVAESDREQNVGRTHEVVNLNMTFAGEALSFDDLGNL